MGRTFETHGKQPVKQFENGTGRERARPVSRGLAAEADNRQLLLSRRAVAPDAAGHPVGAPWVATTSVTSSVADGAAAPDPALLPDGLLAIGDMARAFDASRRALRFCEDRVLRGSRSPDAAPASPLPVPTPIV